MNITKENANEYIEILQRQIRDAQRIITELNEIGNKIRNPKLNPIHYYISVELQNALYKERSVADMVKNLKNAIKLLVELHDRP